MVCSPWFFLLPVPEPQEQIEVVGDLSESSQEAGDRGCRVKLPPQNQSRRDLRIGTICPGCGCRHCSAMWPVAKKSAGGRAPNRMPSGSRKTSCLCCHRSRCWCRIDPNVNEPRGHEARLLIPLLISLMVCFYVPCKNSFCFVFSVEKVLVRLSLRIFFFSPPKRSNLSRKCIFHQDAYNIIYWSKYNHFESERRHCQ